MMSPSNLAVIVAAVLAAACGSDSAKSPENADAVFGAWTNAGLEVSEHAPLEKHDLGDARCMRGEVAKVETVVCAYDSAEAATKARDAGLAMVGQHTGASLARGTLLLIVTDRAKADPDGKTINLLTKTFLGR
ncbi:MAG TPA: hypothetical protein VML75_05610 [Kofleriaceae bacterium]|nr:hypothetical protein [Kofleriaceae bacterium]